MQHLVDIDVALASPGPPEVLNAVPGIDQDTVQIEQDCIAVILEHMMIVGHALSNFLI
jgi:hypothetical protein